MQLASFKAVTIVQSVGHSSRFKSFVKYFKIDINCLP